MTSRSSRNPATGSFWLIALAALAARAGAAFLTHRYTLFPSYYFNDARLYDATAWQLAQTWLGNGSPPEWNLAYYPYQYLLAFLYYFIGHQPLAAQLIHAALGALCALALAGTGALLFGRRGGLIAGWIFALWPSAVFFQSQLLRDNLVLLCAFAALWALVLACECLENSQPAVFPLLVALAFLTAGACFRWYVMLLAAGAFALAQAGRWIGRKPPPTGQVFLVALFFLVFLAARGAVYRYLRGEPPAPAALDISASALEFNVRRLHPKAISDLRGMMQSGVQILDPRPVQTLIRPGTEFRSWGDVALFLPGGLFYTTFMPLPGFYPMNGNPGRRLAAAENVALLLLAFLSLWGLVLWNRWSGHWTLILYAGAAAVVSAFFEPDLGAASRHKLQYLPFVVLFAAPIIEIGFELLLGGPAGAWAGGARKKK